MDGPPPLDGARGGHTPFMTIDSDVVRRLVDADDDAVLVLLEGRAEVVGGGHLDDDDHLGALRVISRTDFLQRVGDASGLSDDEVAKHAAILDAEVSELGG
jgi:NADH dehydrogenase